MKLGFSLLPRNKDSIKLTSILLFDNCLEKTGFSSNNNLLIECFSQNEISISDMHLLFSLLLILNFISPNSSIRSG